MQALRRLDTRVFGFFTFCLNLFLYTILRVQIGIKKIVIVFFENFFIFIPWGGMEGFGGARMTNIA